MSSSPVTSTPLTPRLPIKYKELHPNIFTFLRISKLSPTGRTLTLAPSLSYSLPFALELLLRAPYLPTYPRLCYLPPLLSTSHSASSSPGLYISITLAVCKYGATPQVLTIQNARCFCVQGDVLCHSLRQDPMESA